MQLLTADAASAEGGAGASWFPQRDAGSPQLPPYMAQAAAGQLAGSRIDSRGRINSAGGGNTGSQFGLPDQQQFAAAQPRQPARLKGISQPGVGWLGNNAEAAGALGGRMTPAFESPRSVDSAPVSPGPDLMRRYNAGGGGATPAPFPTPVFPTPARFSPQPSPRGSAAHRAASTAPVHPSPLAHSSGSGSGSGLETPSLPQSTGTGFFCPAVSATAPRSRGARSNRQRARGDGPSAAATSTSDAGVRSLCAVSFAGSLGFYRPSGSCNAFQTEFHKLCAAALRRHAD